MDTTFRDLPLMMNLPMRLWLDVEGLPFAKNALAKLDYTESLKRLLN
jgi:hypothetical protein